MDRSDTPDAPKPPRPPRVTPRDARLKAALKANMGRRKAQARERAAAGGAVPSETEDGPESEDWADNDTKNQ